MKVFSCWTLALALIFSSSLTLSNTGTGTVHAKANAKNISLAENSVSILPKSDVVAVLDISRLVNDLLPKAKQAWPEQMAKAEKELNEFISEAAKDGVDLYKVKSLTIGLKMFGDKVTGAMIVDGLTVTPEMMAKENKDSKAVEYKGKTLYIETPKPEPKVATKTPAKRTGKSTAAAGSKSKTGAKAKPASAKAKPQGPGGIPMGNMTDLASNMSAGFLKGNTAFVQLDPERMALGDEAEVKAVIDALTGSPDPTINIGSDLTAALQETKSSGLLRFAVNIPDSARQAAQSEDFLRNLAVTKMVLGTLDVTDDMSLSLDTKLRTASADDATKLHESLAALLGLGKMMLGGNQDPMMLMLNKVLEQIRLSPQANDVSLALTIPRELYETFLKSTPPATPTKNDK
ncbi:MAG: hypothetical protein JNM09_01370 [Blastocatellia bacterium]|nr:hypothetical protein [Blastocatellia bacterium]